MNCQLITQKMPALRGFNRIYVTDDIGYGYVGRCQLFHEARVAIDPFDVCFIPVELERLAAIGRDRFEWIVVDFRTGNYWDPLVQQIGELTNDAALCLTAKTEKNDVMSRENSVDQLRDNCLVITGNAGK